MWRETTAPLWEHSVRVGNHRTRFTLPLSKDDFFFGIRSVDTDGQSQQGELPDPLF